MYIYSSNILNTGLEQFYIVVLVLLLKGGLHRFFNLSSCNWSSLMFMKNWHIFFPLGLCLIGGLWAVQKLDLCDIINRESKLIETTGF